MDLFFSIVFGMLGVAYTMYGRKQNDFYFILAGLGLVSYTFVVDTTAEVIWVGAILAVIPFILSKYF